MAIGNFTPIRNGILEHFQRGDLAPFDAGVYLLLHLRADWSSGIYHGCALGIACNFGDPKLKEHVQKSLRRLRKRGYINYKKGDGSRHGYPILINKYEPTVGELSGTRLNAWRHGELVKAEYEPQNGDGAVRTRKGHGDGTVGAPIQDLKTMQDVQDAKTTLTPMGAGIPKPNLPGEEKSELQLPDWLPRENWTGFVEMRHQTKPYPTPRAFRLIIAKLEKLRAQGNDPAEVLDQSVERCWKSVFPLQGNQEKNYAGNGNRAERRQADNITAGQEAVEILQRRRMAN